MTLFDLTYGSRSQETQQRLALVAMRAREALTQPKPPIHAVEPKEAPREIHSKTFEEVLDRFCEEGVGSRAMPWRDHLPAIDTYPPSISNPTPKRITSRRPVDEIWAEEQALRAEQNRRHFVAFIHEYGHTRGHRGKRNCGRKRLEKYRPVTI